MDTDEPMLRVVRGHPTEAEVAALVAVVGRRGGAAPGGPPVGPSAWVRSARPGATIAGRPAGRGRHAWRDSALPR